MTHDPKVERRLIKIDPVSLFKYYKLQNDSDFNNLANALQDNTCRLRFHLIFMSTPLMMNKFMQALASAIAQTKTTKLGMSLSDPPDQLHIAHLMLKAVEESPTIVDLELYSFPSDSAATASLADSMSKLRSLNLVLWGHDVQPDFCLFSEKLPQTTTLTKLCFRETLFLGGEILWRGLANNTSIKTLIIDRCGIADGKIKSFIKNWRTDSPLCTLEFPNNTIRQKGAVMLVQATLSHPAMKHLNLSGNTKITFEGLRLIAKELPHLALSELRIRACRRVYPSDTHIYRRIGQLILEGAKINHNFQVLDVSQNGFCDRYDARNYSTRTSGHVGYGDRDYRSAVRRFDEKLKKYITRNRCNQLFLASQGGRETSYVPPATIWCHVFANHARDANTIYHYLREQPMLWSRQGCTEEMGMSRTTTATNSRKRQQNCSRDDWEWRNKRGKSTLSTP